MKKKYFNILIILGIVFLDQLSKFLIVKNLSLGEIYNIVGNFFVFQFVENYGMAFGIGSNILPFNYQKIVFTTFMIIAIIIVIIFYFQLKKEDYLEKLSFSLILGGAFGNLFDKLFGYIIFHQKFEFMYGRVVDFIQFRVKNYIGPTFNIADIFITIGIILLFISSYMHTDKENK